MPHVQGTPEQMKAFMKVDIEGPIHMLNMLQFKEDGGREKYGEYAAHAEPHLAEAGGKVVYRSVGRSTVVGGENWDEVFIVEYPSREAFLNMILGEEYQKGMHLRHEGLEDSRLICLQASDSKASLEH